MNSETFTMTLKDILINRWLSQQESWLNFKLNSETSLLQQAIKSLTTIESMLLSMKSSENKKSLKEQTTKPITKTINWSLRSKSWKPGLTKLTPFTLETTRKSRRSLSLKLKSECTRRESLLIAKKLSKLLPKQLLEQQLQDNLEDHQLAENKSSEVVTDL